MLSRISPMLFLLVFLLSACNTTPPQPFQIDGVWGGVMNHQGTDFAIFAFDSTTTSDGVVSGSGLIRTSSDIYVSVSGSTKPGSVNLTLTDLYNDSIFYSGNVEGDVIRGTWSYPSLSYSGSFRMVFEDNVELLSSLDQIDGTEGKLSDLF